MGYDEVSSLYRIPEQGTALRKFYKSFLGRIDKIPREICNFTENPDLPMIDGFHADFIMGQLEEIYTLQNMRRKRPCITGTGRRMP
ncbi:hypothetical protein BFW01_g7626 [Lasiodiplodia theobromae]|nr:hypothetical protein BFW01_g7626 [Lasiodiplodia theobromae]